MPLLLLSLLLLFILERSAVRLPVCDGDSANSYTHQKLSKNQLLLLLPREINGEME